MKVLNFGKGKGTYAIALATIVWAIYGWATGLIDPVMAQGIIFAGFGALGFRRAIK